MPYWNKRLLAAASTDDPKFVKECLENGAKANCKDSTGWTPLHLAAQSGCKETAILLIAHGAKVCRNKKNGWTPLHCATLKDGLETASLLITHGANIDVQAIDGRTPLHWASLMDSTRTAGLLISHGANVNSQTKTGWTPLQYASYRGRIETVRLLIKHGANLQIENEDGETPLHQAALSGYKDVAGLLISHGALADIRTNYGQTPFDLATGQAKELLKSLDEKDAQNVHTGDFEKRDHDVMLNRLLGEGSYESFDMRVMVTGKFGVGKTSLVMILVGDNISTFRQATDGISLMEGRCGLGITGKEWMLIDKDEYNALDVVYNKVMMSQEECTSNVETTSKTKHQPIKEAVSTCRPQEEEKKLSPVSTVKETTAYQEVYKSKSSSLPFEERKQMYIWQHHTMRAQMTKDEIRRNMEMVLKSGKYQMKVGRLIFWDFGGQYIYYTTHQTFMTYRALFLVVFDGSKGLHEEVQDVEYFPVEYGTPTAAVFLQHWVNSILTYCKMLIPGIPKILFVATHKDKVPKTSVEEIRKTLYSGIEELFVDYEGRNHLVLEPKLFVNATDKNDPEINTLKQTITDLTFKHPCWGERMPNTWVPLELEVAKLVAEGKRILSLREMEDLNKASEVSVLSQEDLKFFLQFQHSLGKIVYFDTFQLREYVIISPLFMVEVIKSFITDKQFWPEDHRIRQLFTKMSINGVIQKRDLFEIWQQPKLSEIDKHKEFIIDMLIHLDILSVQRRYNVETGSGLNTDEYFVPCMLIKRNETNYMTKECAIGRSISLAFVFKGTIIPPALPNRLISACLSMWSVKEYYGQRLLFSGFVVFSRDKSHDIVICVESTRIVLYIIHNRSKGLIVRDIAAGVRECINTTLERISEFYQSSINPKKSCRELPFNVEFACSDLKCYVPESAALCDKTCSKHGTNVELDVWFPNKSVDSCDTTCEGLSADALQMIPSDPELLRLSFQLSDVSVKELIKRLGLAYQQWDDINRNYPRDISMVKFLILVKWRNMMNGTYKDLAEKLVVVGYTPHELCHVRRMKIIHSDIADEYLDSVPTDEILDALAPEIGLVSFQLGIELGRSVPELEAIQYNYTGDLIAQTRQILHNWRNDRSMKATLNMLQQALVNVQRGTHCLKSIVDELGVKKHHFSSKQEYISELTNISAEGQFAANTVIRSEEPQIYTEVTHL